MVSRKLHGKFRDECLSLEWFRSRAEAKVIIEAWRRHNEVRPHSSLNYLTPNKFVARGARPALRQATGRTLRYMGLRAPARCATVPSGTNAPSQGSQSPPQEANGPGSVIAMLVSRTKASEGHGEPLIGSSWTSQLMKSMVRISVWQRLLSRRIRLPIQHGMDLSKVLSAPAQPAIDSSLASLRSLHRQTPQSSCFGTLPQTRVA